MVNDPNIEPPFVWKFVHDTTTSEIIEKGNASNAQSLINGQHDNRVQLNPDECKAKRICHVHS